MERPLFVNSIPKSGTYLLAAILEEHGFDFTHWHVFENFYDDYAGVPLDIARRHPERCRVRQPIEQTIAKLRPGQFAVGHLPYNDRTQRALRNCFVIFLKRDLRECLVSHMRWQHATGRDRSAWTRIEDPQQRMLAYLEKRGRSFIGRVRAIAEWQDHADRVLTFDNLRDVSRLGIPRAATSGTSMSAAEPRYPTKGTLTQMPMADRRRFWSAAAEAKFLQLLGSELNATLGFHGNCFCGSAGG